MISPRLRLGAVICMLSLIFWGTLGIVADLLGAQWPVGNDAYQDVGLVVLVVEFLAVKSYLMITRTTRFTRLGVSLIAANVAFGIVYGVALVLGLFPFISLGEFWFKIPLRVMLVVVLSWGTFELLANASVDLDKSVLSTRLLGVLAIVTILMGIILLSYTGIVQLPVFPTLLGMGSRPTGGLS